MTELSPAAQALFEAAWVVTSFEDEEQSADPVPNPSYAAKAAIEAYMDENCGDEMMPSEIAALAAAFRAVALYLSNDCQELTSIATELEAL